MIEVFGFNTTNGGMFEMRNTTIEEIKSELKKKYPKWSDETIEKIVSNKSYYNVVIPVETEKKEQKGRRIKSGSIAKSSICINGYELNPILTLGQSIHTYRKFHYKNWGNIAKKIFSNQTISTRYEDFEKSYANVVEAIKSKPMATKQIITSRVIEMCDKMDALKDAFERSGILKEDLDEDYVKGYTNKKRTAHKLGIGELMSRIGEEVCNFKSHNNSSHQSANK